jgi:hypothetical protein
MSMDAAAGASNTTSPSVGEVCGPGNDEIHGSSVRGGKVDDRDIGRVSGQRVGDLGAVLADQHDPAQAICVLAHELVDLGSLEQAPGDPDDRREGGQARRGGMRVRGLGVIDVANTADDAGLGDPVRLRA